MTTKTQCREAREEADYGYYLEPDPKNFNNVVGHWKANQIYNDGILPWIDGCHIEVLCKAKAEALELKRCIKHPKSAYREVDHMLAGSAENGFPQPDPYDDDDAECMV